MMKGMLLGIVLGAAGLAACIYGYFATGHAPVATAAPEIPLERKFVQMALHSYLDKLPHPEPQIPADEKNLLEGAKVYKIHCAVCHGLPDAAKTAIAEGMAPKPPQLFKGTGVTDDEAWESYWKIENGLRMSGMPGFKGHLTETEVWQVAVLVKNADRITPAVKAELTAAGAALAAPTAPPAAIRK
jgi:thiosulfate dehydrogenase